VLNEDRPAGNGAHPRAIVLHPHRKTGNGSLREPEARLEEAVGLARAIDLDVASASLVSVGRPNPGLFFGTGKAETLGGSIAERKIDIAIIDGALTPIQQRNLERQWKCKVLDRTALILEIFGERARTREGQLQVELAHLTYQRSRLVRSWTHLERQRGGFGFLGGPGETQIESDRRQIGERIVRIKQELEGVKRTRHLQRTSRKRAGLPVVALVGYTNAGKSTLFNQLTKSEVYAENLLFATLDPTMRAVRLPSGRSIVLSDTVGFVSDLPTDLVAAFRATLEEVIEADLLLHVRDIAHPDSAAQRADVLAVLAELGIEEDGRVIEVWNKLDQLDAEARAVVANRTARGDDTAAISALTGEGCDGLLRLIDERLARHLEIVELDVPLSDGATIAWLYRSGEVLSRTDDERAAHVRVRLDAANRARVQRRLDGAG
jgi:GTP-binding protein HflX